MIERERTTGRDDLRREGFRRDERSRDDLRRDAIRQDERSFGELLGELYRGASEVIRLEVELAKTEMSQKASRVGKDVGFLAAGGAVAYAGFLAIIAGLIGLLGLLIPVWLSALLIGIAVAAAGGYLVKSGLDALQQEQAAPQRTIETIKEDREWIENQRR